MSSFKERLSDLIEGLGMKNPREFTVKLGYDKPEKIYRLLRDENTSPSFEILSDLIKSFPNVNPTWLLIGKGEMLSTTESNNTSSTLPGIKCTNPGCIEKINQLINDLENEKFNRNILLGRIKQLEAEKGASGPEKRDQGSVEKPGENKKAS